jgi:hypothetical protein
MATMQGSYSADELTDAQLDQVAGGVDVLRLLSQLWHQAALDAWAADGLPGDFDVYVNIEMNPSDDPWG